LDKSRRVASSSPWAAAANVEGKTADDAPTPKALIKFLRDNLKFMANYPYIFKINNDRFCFAKSS
jgi:hypothetical protein